MTGAVDERGRARRVDPERAEAGLARQQVRNAATSATIAAIEARGERVDAEVGGRGQAGLEQLVRILGVRARRVAEALEEGDGTLADRIGGLLAYVDAVDEELSRVERWAVGVARQAGVNFDAERAAHRVHLGLPAEEVVDLRDLRSGSGGLTGLFGALNCAGWGEPLGLGFDLGSAEFAVPGRGAREGDHG